MRPGTWHPDGAVPRARPSRSRRVPWRLLLVGGAVAVSAIYGAITSADRGDDGQITGAGTLAADELAVGDCIAAVGAVEFDQVDAVPCIEPHDEEIYLVAELTGYASGTEYPGDEQLFAAAGERCYEQFEGFVGRSYESSVLDFSLAVPAREGWQAGDRVFTCSIYDPAGPVTGTLRDADR